MIKIGIDAMGGDYGINTTVNASIMAVKKFKDIELVLYGDSEIINPMIKGINNITVKHTTQVLDMGEKDALRAIRTMKEASMLVALKDGKNKEVDAVVSSGPTQCLVAGAHFIVRKLENMSRVALCPIIPSIDKKGRLLLDVGANLELKPEHLLDLSIFASVVCKEVLNIENPKVGLLNIGTEPGKGREVDKETFNLLSESKFLDFYGNVESKDILTCSADILITDGFTGNMIIKTMEGTAKAMGTMLKEELKGSLSGIIGALFAKKRLKRLSKRLDSSEIGGAMILGINIPVIKAHGSSNSYAFFNAIRQARQMVVSECIPKVINSLPNKEEENA